MGALPMPPEHLQRRVGPGDFELIGKFCADYVRSVVPRQRLEPGSRILDFGCGAGRTLRHFALERPHADLYGCDIDGDSIEWLRTNAARDITAVQNAEEPPTPFSDGYFDVIYAMSVFTHIGQTWARWLTELHRVAKPDAWIVATFLGPSFAQEVIGRRIERDRLGMLVTKPENPWHSGGPFVILSPWWIHEHWGRLFHLLVLQEDGFGNDRVHPTQGVAVMRPKRDALTAEELASPNHTDPREAEALLEARAVLEQERQELSRDETSDEA